MSAEVRQRAHAAQRAGQQGAPDVTGEGSPVVYMMEPVESPSMPSEGPAPLERPLRGETSARLVQLYRQHQKGSIGIRCHRGHADCACTVVPGMDLRAECAEDVIAELEARGILAGDQVRHVGIGPVSAPGTSAPVPILSAHDEFVAKDALASMQDGRPLRAEHQRCLVAYVAYLTADRDRLVEARDIARLQAQHPLRVVDGNGDVALAVDLQEVTHG